MNPINHLSAPKCHCPEWIGTSHYGFKEGGGFEECLERDRAHNIDSKISYDFFNNYLYLYFCIQLILLSGNICIRLSGKLDYPELSVSGKFYYPCIPNSLFDIILQFLAIWHYSQFGRAFGYPLKYTSQILCSKIKKKKGNVGAGCWEFLRPWELGVFEKEMGLFWVGAQGHRGQKTFFQEESPHSFPVLRIRK